MCLTTRREQQLGLPVHESMLGLACVASSHPFRRHSLPCRESCRAIEGEALVRLDAATEGG